MPGYAATDLPIRPPRALAAGIITPSCSVAPSTPLVKRDRWISVEQAPRNADSPREGAAWIVHLDWGPAITIIGLPFTPSGVLP